MLLVVCVLPENKRIASLAAEAEIGGNLCLVLLASENPNPEQVPPC